MRFLCVASATHFLIYGGVLYEKGVKFGRPKAILPPNTIDILDKYINKELTNILAARLIGVSRGTFFRLVKERKLLKNSMKI